MSLTQTHHVFAGVHETGLNDLLRVFLTARPRHLKFGTPPYVQTPADGTQMQPISIGLLTIAYVVTFAIPIADITPGAAGIVPAPGPNQFVLMTSATLTIDINGNSTNGSFNVVALCAPVVTNGQSGSGTIGINVIQATPTNVTPAWLQPAVNAILQALVQQVAAMSFPFNTLTVGAFQFNLLAGPTAIADEIQMRGDAL